MENAGRALLLVAHPDDCIIFGYPFLHDHPKFKWDIIYLTYFDKDDRAREVRSFWRKHNIDTYFLGNRDDYSYVERGEKVVAFGYGLDENGDDVVERVELGGLPLKATYLDVEGVSPEFIRTISDGGGDTCQGDSGGPILMQGIDDEYGLIAVVSFGPNTCEPNVGFPSANTNLQSASVHDFIVSIAGNVNLN